MGFPVIEMAFGTSCIVFIYRGSLLYLSYDPISGAGKIMVGICDCLPFKYSFFCNRTAASVISFLRINIDKKFNDRML